MSNSSNDVMSNDNIDPWDHDKHVLALGSFPSTSILRYRKIWSGDHIKPPCSCSEGQEHRDLFSFNRLFVADCMVGKTCRLPSIRVCHNTENIWESRLPRALTGLENRITFDKLPTVRHALKVLKRGTWWYPQLSKGKFGRNSFTRAIARLLAGLTTPDGRENWAEVKSAKLNNSSVQRLRSMLAVVDGLLMQVVLAFPGSPEFQNWKRIDQISRSMISNILVDYFKDLNPERITTYEKVKMVRKSIKEMGFNPIKSMKDVVVPRELSAIRVALSLIRGETPLKYYQVMIMSQTRASGVPPRSVYEKTLKKTREVLMTPSSPDLYESVKGPLTRAVDHLYSELLTRVSNKDGFFESVVKSSKISLSDSGEFFVKTDDGGKLEAARRVLKAHPEIDEINLHTGERTGNVLTKENSKPGERLFHWSCGKFTDRSKIYQNNSMSCRISLVAELGKYRLITVSALQHAVLLHPFSHMGLKILEAFPSSESGVGAANHAWNFFQRISHKNPSASFVFNETNTTSVFSTDWSEATNYSDPYVARAMLNRLMYSLGVPNWYRESVILALTAPRQVEYMDRNGVPISLEYTKRGVLMGDPVTKIVLHLTHLVGSKMAGLLLFDIFRSEESLDSNRVAESDSDSSDDE